MGYATFDEARIAAQDAGLLTYRGSPCRRGHDGERYSTNGGCVACANEKRPKKTVRPVARRPRQRFHWMPIQQALRRMAERHHV